MKSKVAMVTVLAAVMLLAGCGGRIDKDTVLNDLKKYGSVNFLASQEEIDDFVLENTEKQKEWSTVTGIMKTHNEEVNYEKPVEIVYHKGEDGWKVDDISVSAASKWSYAPRDGVTEEKIVESVGGKNFQIDDEAWNINSGNTEVTIKEQNTNLEEGKDKVTASVTIDDAVYEANGILELEYEFKDGRWQLVNMEDRDFETTVKDGTELELSEDQIMEAISSEEIVLGEGSGIGEAYQKLNIKDFEVADFQIVDVEEKNKGREQVYHCTMTLNKPKIQLADESYLTYYYEDGWNEKEVKNKVTVTSVDLNGMWAGTYHYAPCQGNATVALTQKEDGSFEGVYSWTETHPTEESGSYSITAPVGSFDQDNLILRLSSGEWIEKPAKINEKTYKTSMTLVYQINEDKLEGSGHHNSTVSLQRQ